MRGRKQYLKLIARLDEEYKLSKGGEEPPNVDEIKRLWKKYAIAIYKQSPKKNKLYHDSVRAFSSVFVNGIFDGYGVKDEFIEFGTPDGHAIEALLNNCYYFSEAKTRTQLKYLTLALINPENGEKRSLSEFRKYAMEIVDTYCGKNLKAEYNMAINCAQMSSRWVEAQRDKHIFPQLQFDAVIDDRTTDHCRSFDGKVFAVDDPIWDIIYPPNHWGCRSIVRKVSGKKVDDSAKLDTDSVKDGWRNNLAKTGIPWPKDSSYYKDANHDTIVNDVGNAAFKLVKRKGKGIVFESEMHTKKPYNSVLNKHEREVRLEAAKALADKYDEVFLILPEMEIQDFRYKYYFNNIPYINKVPDLKGKETWECANIDRKLGKKSISNIFKKIGTQADNLAIVVTNVTEEEFLKIKQKIEKKSIKGKVEIIYNNKAY